LADVKHVKDNEIVTLPKNMKLLELLKRNQLAKKVYFMTKDLNPLYLGEKQ
jgi:hypothetical protein